MSELHNGLQYYFWEEEKKGFHNIAGQTSDIFVKHLSEGINLTLCVDFAVIELRLTS